MVKGKVNPFKADPSWFKANSLVVHGQNIVQGQAGSHDSCFKANNSWLKARSIIRGSRPGRSRFKANPSRVPFKSPFRVPFTVPFRVTFWIPSV